MINSKLKELDFESHFKFALFSMGRVQDLYQLFIEEIRQNNLSALSEYLEGDSVLNEISNSLKKSFPKFEQEELDEHIQKSYSLTVRGDIHSSFQSTIATQIALMHVSALQFIRSKDVNLLEDVSIYISEIINIVESEKFFSSNPNGDYSESEQIITKAIKLDEANQLEVLNAIQEIGFNEEKFDLLIEQNKLIFN
ncbi:MAG: hypothetical protein P8P74_05585 [Crocinitomicaceae bacterium]|nr:hypothetical protein [Crocinitomicaceae bacterium]